MAFMFIRRSVTLTPVLNSNFLLRVRNLSSRASTVNGNENEATQLESVNDKPITSPNYSSGIHLSPLFSHARPHLDGYDIELVDPDTWRVSSGLAQAWRGEDGVLETRFSFAEAADESVDFSLPFEADPDFDEIEDMRIRGNLFYKLDRDSKEFEEYNFKFPGKKSSKNKNDQKESKKKENPDHNSAARGEKLPKLMNNKRVTTPVDEMDSSSVGKKKLRTPTFNQLTGPYHEPFCLDLYISKSSVRACIVHRVTSKVVAVAHSISKDMKFDLASTRDSTACAAVGGVLAQRALADDIHDVVYTPRKGEKLVGKLQIVLQSIIDNGINVKVKIKQRRPKKAGHPSTA